LSAVGAGTTLCEGRYRLDAILGRGGMAIVWRATDLQLERDVAIKVISDVLAEDPRFVARFEREARLAAGLNHPNLVKVFDFSVDTERPFLIMEYVAGGTLAEARGQALDVDSLARELLDAIAHIHAAGILHRDIKPANVLLGPDRSPRLTDFGIARGDETSGLTQTGQVLGTLRYIAPEVAAGDPATAQSDLYGLGVMLGELAGAPSESLAQLLPRLTAREPSDRPASAADALAELDPTVRLGGLTPEAGKAAPAEGGLTPYGGESYGGVRGQTPPSVTRVLRDSVAFSRPVRIRRSHAIAAGVALLVVLALVIAAASGGGGSDGGTASTQLRPAPAGAPVNQQLDRLEQIVRAAPRKR
jgi:eukaryotic-like serine/threonine-protein kinase